MGRVGLLEPLLEDGIRNTNFFNGRLLSADDLKTEQESVRARIAHAGRAAGAGVVAGLWVEKVASSTPSDARHAAVSVTAGLAVCRAGHALQLPAATEVALVPAPDDPTAEDAGLFQTCLPPTTSTVVTGAGIYVLALTSASGYEGKAQASGLTDVSAGSCCGARYAVEGVRFKLVKLDVLKNTRVGSDTAARLVAYMKKGDAKSLSLLRNELAYSCFGAPAFDEFTRDPFARAADEGVEADDEGALGALRDDGSLTDCDVPLALIYWSRRGVEFVDAWAARRRVTRPAHPDRWSEVEDDSRAAVGEAAMRQFQDHLRALVRAGASAKDFAARDYFRYLPPVGFLPAADDGAGTSSLFEARRFFAGVTVLPPVHMEGARLGALVRHAAPFAAHDLDSKQMLRLYYVRQNAQALDDGAASSRCVIFASGHVPFAGEARFDISLFDYSNYV
ncbi:MAG: hypothetical protein LC746_08620 [Acidobacteria bacterium]|nr:hypothetical protein [Acidobacteriota bacterium]